MNLTEWAKREVELACKREKPDRKEGEWDYGCACYESALKAFNSLIEDGHSGMSIGFTKQILNRLIDCKPLIPITDEDFYVPEDGIHENPTYLKDRGLKSSIQCPRMSSLFRDEYLDGTVKYTDVNRVICFDVNKPDIPYSNGFIRKIIDEMYPITMPYLPTYEPFKVYTEECLTDRKNGDFDTLSINYLIEPNGTKVGIWRYFKESDHGFVEIDFAEWAGKYLRQGMIDGIASKVNDVAARAALMGKSAAETMKILKGDKND